MDHSDNRLIENFFSGDETAFNDLVKKYLKPVYNFLYQFVSDREILDDITQDTFIKAWKNLEKFDQDRSLKTWLFTIAKNTAYDYLKKKKTIPFSFFKNDEGYSKLEEISEDKILPDEFLMRTDSAEIIEKKLEKIPIHYRIILVMHYKDDFSLHEIAQILDIPYNTVKSQHQRGLKILKNEFPISHPTK